MSAPNHHHPPVNNSHRALALDGCELIAAKQMLLLRDVDVDVDVVININPPQPSPSPSKKRRVIRRSGVRLSKRRPADWGGRAPGKKRLFAIATAAADARRPDARRPDDRDDAPLLRRARSLCEDIVNETSSPERILEHFSRSSHDDDDDENEILCIQHHGHGQGQHPMLPFLEREFRGRDGAKEYFDLVSRSMSREGVRFSEYLVDDDAEGLSVLVRGEATVTWRATGQTYDEKLAIHLRFDERGEKVVRFEAWADGLAKSKYLAAGDGQLSSIVTARSA